MGNTSWIFFDMGGTLVDESAQVSHIVEAIHEGFLRFGLDYKPDDIYSLLIEASQNFEKSPEAAAIRALSKSQEQYESLLPAVRYLHELEILFPGVPELLKALSSKYHLGIIGNQAPGGEEWLKQYGIHHYFSVFALSAELNLKKPDPRIFEYALNEARCNAKCAVYVGDRLDNDIYPAKRLGFTTVRVLQGFAKYQEAPLADYVPDFTIDTVTELDRIFI